MTLVGDSRGQGIGEAFLRKKTSSSIGCIEIRFKFLQVVKKWHWLVIAKGKVLEWLFARKTNSSIGCIGYIEIKHLNRFEQS